MCTYLVILVIFLSVLSKTAFAEDNANNNTTADVQGNVTYSWYSTVGEMKNMTEMEADMLGKLNRRVAIGEVQIKIVKNHIEEMRKIGKHILNMNVLSGNYKSELASRYEEDWQKLTKQLRFVFGRPYVSRFEKKQSLLPTEDDYAAVLQSLWELQKMYNLNATDLGNGYIFGRYSGRRLSTDTCGFMAMLTCEDSTEQCREWTNMVLARLKAGDDSHFKEKDTKALMENHLTKKIFEDVCSGALSEYSEKKLSKSLQCYMWTNYNHPWLILQPVAMEMLSTSPPVARFFNVLSDKDAEVIKSLALPELKSAGTFVDKSKVNPDSYRIAHSAWLSKKNNTMLQRLDNFISAITGLKVAKSAERLQVANYGISGRYGGHYDQMNFSPKQEMHLINRKATFMLYLSDVEFGGATVFLESKLVVKPIKGSALFWYNILPSGESDKRTTHGSCPVLLGDKWVGNKWIWETTREVCKLSEYIGRIH